MQGEEEARKSSAFSWILGIVLIAVLYVGSIGPVIGCYVKFTDENETVAICVGCFYYPLIYAAENNERIDRYLTWYIDDLWAAKIFGLDV